MHLAEINERLQRGEIVLIDGATGTELERRGVPMVEEAWNAGGVLTHPDVVRQVHEDYIRLGAEVIITNTFSTGRHWLGRAGLDEHFEFLNRQAALLAQEARANVGADGVLVAGGIFMSPGAREVMKTAVIQTALNDQAQIFADAGVDFIMLEMMCDIEITRLAIQAARRAGLPVWVGMSCRLDENGVPYMTDGKTKLADFVEAIRTEPIEMMLVMHTLTQDIDACLDVLQLRWDGVMGVYAHSGKFDPPNWQFIDMITPEDYAETAVSWLKRGVQVIGGCCGIGPEHIAVLRQRVDTFRHS